MKISVRIDDARAVAAFARAPEVMRRIVGDAVGRGALEVTREARSRAPKVFSTLTNSINATQIGDLHWQVRAGVNYARAVEEGTKPGYTPNLLTLRMYIQASTIRGTGFRWGKAGTSKRTTQEDDIARRTSALAWYIRAHGTKAHPYLQPAVDAKESRVIALIREAAFKGAAEVMR